LNGPSYDFIVVGSGAGGGTVAARLAEAGHTVLLLEAGGDPLDLKADRLPEDYQVPAFHAFASENPALRWDFFVRHYGDDQRQKLDRKFTAERDGVLYPRAAALGGCTAHNAMIFVYPHNSDWDQIAELTGDFSWRAENMRRYFERLEDCWHRKPLRWLKQLTGINPSRHGFGGWLSVEQPRPPRHALRDRNMMHVIEQSAFAALRRLRHPLLRFLWFIKAKADPNDWRMVRNNGFGVCYAPLTTRVSARTGSRERVLDVARRFPERLRIELDALATRVLFDENRRAVGVEYLKGRHLYRAHAQPSREPGERCEAHAAREVILSGGAFNTPQLLMLSGIGARQELEQHRIQCRVELPGVGANLQDRYEVSVVNRMRSDWEFLAGAQFAKNDRQFARWEHSRSGVYASNGGVLAIINRSSGSLPLPDLFFAGLLGRFEGYFPGYSKLVSAEHNYLSWIVLKAHTANSAGSVTLRSADPRDAPLVNFRYFDEGSDSAGADLDAVVQGIHFVRGMTADLKKDGSIVKEELPGEDFQSDEQLRQYVRNNAWGHHASCSCPIGPENKGGVLTSDFRVHGTRGLRVVDASVFPHIPGFFIASAVYMIGEKAAEVIHADHSAR